MLAFLSCGAERAEFGRLFLRTVLYKCEITNCIVWRKNGLSMRGECVGKGEKLIYKKYFCGMTLRKVFL